LRKLFARKLFARGLFAGRLSPGCGLHGRIIRLVVA
jgi:hypothetical protein